MSDAAGSSIVRRVRTALLAASVIGSASPVLAQHVPVTLSVAAGVFRPSDQLFRDVYGGAEPLWLVQVDARLSGPFGLFGGVRRLTRTGQAVGDEPLEFPIGVRLEVTSLRFGGSVGSRLGRVDVVGRAGADYNIGEEQWPDAGVSTDLRGWGLVGQGSVHVRVWRRLAVLGLLEFTHANVETDDAAERAAIGGLAFAGGLAVGF